MVRRFALRFAAGANTREVAFFPRPSPSPSPSTSPPYPSLFACIASLEAEILVAHHLPSFIVLSRFFGIPVTPFRVPRRSFWLSSVPSFVPQRTKAPKTTSTTLSTVYRRFLHRSRQAFLRTDSEAFIHLIPHRLDDADFSTKLCGYSPFKLTANSPPRAQALTPRPIFSLVHNSIANCHEHIRLDTIPQHLHWPLTTFADAIARKIRYDANHRISHEHGDGPDAVPGSFGRYRPKLVCFASPSSKEYPDPAAEEPKAAEGNAGPAHHP